MGGRGAQGRGLYSVFYDLETTTKFNVGQILNYCFTLVAPDLTPVRELAGRVRISRLELPAPGAILANRTNVLDHQATTTDTEPVAMNRIAEFLWAAVREHEAVNLIGYNSSKFDLQYLRTSLARNGINPYFGGRLFYRDLYHAAKKLAVSAPDFPRGPAPRPRLGDEGRLSLSLETLTRAAGILTEAQRHEAKADVEITLKLAVHFRDTFGLDVTSFQGYEALAYHRKPRSGEVVWMMEPNYDLSSAERVALAPMILLEGTDRSALWVDLERYRGGAGRGAIRWMNPGTKYFFCGAPPLEARGDLAATATQALEDFRGVSLATYFSTTDCDIEEHIYRLSAPLIDGLGQALKRGDPTAIRECADAFILYKRHRLAFDEIPADDAERRARADKVLRLYALHRYGGEMVMVRRLDETVMESPYHPTLQALVGELRSLLEGATSGEDRALLSALSAFYASSDIVRVAGAELGFSHESAPAVDETSPEGRAS